MNETVLLDVAEGVATLTLNRPEVLNAINADMKDALLDATTRIEYDDAVRAVVIKGAGAHFMAGGDVKRFYAERDNDPHWKRRRFLEGISEMHPIIFSLRRMAKPVIASVHGYAAGFGVSLAIAADLTIASEDAKFTLAYVRIGTSPDGAGTYYLPRMVGLKRALEIALLGDEFDAPAAKDYGMINFVVPADALEAETVKLAGRLAAGPTHALGNAKRLMNVSIDNQFEQQLQMEAECFASNVETGDFREGVSAFAEKRKPEFKGR
ncbi:MAG: enoyl-CoA hydratase [Alphaproteobacteria bacterium]|jgi:2-(1,2-epoxy-1,2-dihydrophenyl)acetyl-CoA isomerase|nr:enoyl-CoA hydratase [Alphaproteobacteria bacterium]